MDSAVCRPTYRVSNSPAEAFTRDRKACHFSKTTANFAMNITTCRTNGFIAMDWNTNDSSVPGRAVDLSNLSGCFGEITA